MNSISEESNYEKVFSQFKSRFLESNLEETSKVLQLKADDEYLYVPFFYKICRVARETGEITGEKNQEISVTDRLTIMHHLCCYQRFAQESDRKVPFREIKEAAVFEAAYNKAALLPLRERFQGRVEELVWAGMELGGAREKFGDASITLQAFPKISLTYILWEGDEEFPASANILFDNRIAQWTHAESVPVLAETGTKKLIEAAGFSGEVSVLH